MKHVIIGTAGHVDHGKTRLIQALTGIDTDRLEEEKKRGITIELGFAHLDFQDGTQVGIVDVPGHEKFIKNMLSGAGGIDLAMLVVAADEGFMPQTVEHLNILTLLGIRDGLVVITKVDLVEPQQLEVILREVQERARGTFLEGRPIIPVSACTGQNMDFLKCQLRELVEGVAEKDRHIPFRMPIDRVFSVDGFGTVVTGTLIEGCIQKEDAIELLPSGLTTKARNLQVHGTNMDAVYAGQRVAINLTGLMKEDIHRGDTAAKPGSLHVTSMLDVRLQNLPDSKRIISSGSRVHLYHGSNVVLSRVILLETEALNPGESGYAQLRLAEPIAAKSKDRFVIRFFSPLETIGGGIILDTSPRKHKRNDSTVLNDLKIKESGSDEQRLLQALTELGYTLPGQKTLAEKLALEEHTLEGAVQDLLRRGKLMEALPGRYVSADTLDQISEHCRRILANYHAANPLHAGIRPAELCQKLFPAADSAVANTILNILIQEGKLRKIAERYALPEFKIRLTRRQSKIREKLMAIYRKSGVNTPALDVLWSLFPPADQEDCRRVLESLLTNGRLIRISPQTIYHIHTYQRFCQILREWFTTHETLTLAEFRDLLGSSRQTALLILEHFDQNKMTQKDGDLRRVGPVPFPRTPTSPPT